MRKITVLLVDDHSILRDGISSFLQDFDDIHLVGQASDGLEALEKVKSLSPDVLLIDISMPKMSGLQTVEIVNRQFKNTRSIILSMHDSEDYILKSVEMGAFGYLLKDTSKEEMVKAVRTVATGEKYFNGAVSNVILNGYLQKVQQDFKTKDVRIKLSKKEKTVLKFIVDGMSSREVAESMTLSIRTIDNHRANMMKKLKVKNAVELVRVAMERKLI